MQFTFSYIVRYRYRYRSRLRLHVVAFKVIGSTVIFATTDANPDAYYLYYSCCMTGRGGITDITVLLITPPHCCYNPEHNCNSTNITNRSYFLMFPFSTLSHSILRYSTLLHVILPCSTLFHVVYCIYISDVV